MASSNFNTFKGEIDSANSSLNTFISNIDSSVSKVESLFSSFSKITIPVSSLQKLINMNEELRNGIAKTNKLLTEEEAISKQLASATNANTKAQVAYNSAVSTQITELTNSTAILRAKVKEQQLAALATSAEASAYTSLVARYNLARTSVLELSAAKGIDNEETQNAIVEYQKLSAEMSSITTAIDAYGMGAAKATPAAFSFNTIITEIPNFAISARTGIMSLSNNVPMFITQMHALTKATKAGTNEVLGLSGALKSLISPTSLVTLGAVALMTAIQLLLPVITKWFDEMSGGVSIMDKAAGTLKAFTDEAKNGSSQLVSDVAAYDALKFAIDRLEKSGQNMLSTETHKNKVISEGQRLIGDVVGITINSYADLTKAMEKYGAKVEKFWNQQAVANASLRKSSEERIKAFSNEAIIEQNGWTDLYNILKKVTAARTDDVEKGMTLNERYSKTMKELATTARLAGTQFKMIESGTQSTQAIVLRTNSVKRMASELGITLDQLRDFSSKFNELSSQDKEAIVNLTSETTRALYTSQAAAKAARETYIQLFASVKDGAGEAAKELAAYNRTLQNFDWYNSSLSNMSKFWESIAMNDNIGYKRRLEALETYTKAEELLSKSAFTKRIQDAIDQNNKEMREDAVKHAKNLDRASKGAKAVITVVEEGAIEMSMATERFRNEIASGMDISSAVNTFKDSIQKGMQTVKSSLNKDGNTIDAETKNYTDAVLTNYKNMFNKINKLIIDEMAKQNENILDVLRKQGEIIKSELQKTFNQIDLDLNKDILSKDLEEITDRINKFKKDISGESEFNLFFTSVDIEPSEERIDRFNKAMEKAQLPIDAVNKKIEELDMEINRATTSFDYIAKLDAEFTKTADSILSAFRAGEIDETEYNERSQKLALNYEKERNAAVSSAKMTNEQLADLNEERKKLVDERAEYELEKELETAKLIEKALEEHYENVLKQREIFNAQLRELVDNFFVTIEVLSTISNKKKEKEFEEEEKRNEKSKEIQLKSIEGLEDEASLKAEINEHYALKKEELDRRKEEEEQRHTRVMAQIAIGQFLIQSAADFAQIKADMLAFQSTLTASRAALGVAGASSAVSDTLTAYAPILAMFAVNKAVGLASIVAANYEAFAAGGTVQKDGIILVGDGGRNEVLLDNYGNVSVTPDKDTYTYAEKGTRIFKDINDFATFVGKNISDMDIMTHSAINYTGSIQGISKTLNASYKELKRINSPKITIKRKWY